MNPAEIAATLTPAQRKALLFYMPSEDFVEPVDAAHQRHSRALYLAGLLNRWVDPPRAYRMNETGIAVRAILEKEAARDA